MGKWNEAVKALREALEAEGWDAAVETRSWATIEPVVETLASFGFVIVQQWPEDYETNKQGFVEKYETLRQEVLV